MSSLKQALCVIRISSKTCCIWTANEHVSAGSYLANTFSETPPAYGRQNNRSLTLTGDGAIQVDHGSVGAVDTPSGPLASVACASAAIMRTEAL